MLIIMYKRLIIDSLGRLLITLLLCGQRMLREPMPYLSLYVAGTAGGASMKAGTC